MPVTAGCAAPLLRPALHADHVHGESGLGGAVLPAPGGPRRAGTRSTSSSTPIAAAPGEITLVATGPLTNIGLALRREPRLATWVRDFVIMGGSASRGNVTPAAEFNIWADPEAAAIVFGAGWTVRMIGLDVTLLARATAAVQERMSSLGSLGSHAAAARARAVPGLGTTTTGEPPVHDVCAIVSIADPSVFEYTPAQVAVETHGDAHVGDDGDRLLASAAHNARVATADQRRTASGAPCSARTAALPVAQADHSSRLSACRVKAKPGSGGVGQEKGIGGRDDRLVRLDGLLTHLDQVAVAPLLLRRRPARGARRAADRHQTVRPLAIDSTAMSAPWSSARTSLPPNPRVLRSFSSSVIASPGGDGRLPAGLAVRQRCGQREPDRLAAYPGAGQPGPGEVVAPVAVGQLVHDLEAAAAHRVGRGPADGAAGHVAVHPAGKGVEDLADEFHPHGRCPRR